jgi:hypothetical protein
MDACYERCTKAKIFLDRMRQPTTEEVRLDEDKATSSGAVRPACRYLAANGIWLRPNFVAGRLDETENRTQQPGYPEDVGSALRSRSGPIVFRKT